MSHDNEPVVHIFKTAVPAVTSKDYRLGLQDCWNCREYIVPIVAYETMNLERTIFPRHYKECTRGNKHFSLAFCSEYHVTVSTFDYTQVLISIYNVMLSPVSPNIVTAADLRDMQTWAMGVRLSETCPHFTNYHMPLSPSGVSQTKHTLILIPEGWGLLC